MKEGIAAYARLSLDKFGNELAVERQHADIDALASRRGLEVVERYTDNNVSAFQRGVVRPEFERLVRDLKSGKIKGVLAYDLDRLWRKPSDLERIIDIFEVHKGLVFATTQGDYDLSTSDGRLSARVLAAAASKSSEDTARRVKRKIQEQAEQGIPHWAKRPYGYNMDGTLDESEADIVRRMGEWFLHGYSYREIAWRLNEAELFARNGRHWYSGNIKSHLANPRYAAIRVHDGNEYPGRWTAIFTHEQHEEILEKIRHRSASYKGKPNNKRYLLTGLLFCRCGMHLRGMTKRDGKMASLPEGRLRPTYQCPTQSETIRRLPSCGRMCVGAEPLEHFIKELVIARLDTPDLATYLTKTVEPNSKLPALLTERSRLMNSLEELAADYYTDKLLTKDEFKAARDSVQARLTAIDREIDSLHTERFKLELSAGETVREAWESRGDRWRRELLEVLIERIDIHPSSMKPYYVFEGKRTRFDTERVKIHWKV